MEEGWRMESRVVGVNLEEAICVFLSKMGVCARVFGDQCGSSSSLPRLRLPRHPGFPTSTATEA